MAETTELDGLETTDEERRRALDTLGYMGRDTILAKLCRDADKAARLQAEVARLRALLPAPKGDTDV